MSSVFAIAFLAFASTASADCIRTATGRVICNTGQGAAGYNPKSGNAFTSQTNKNGVTTTQTSRGGEAKTKNGKGVVTTPGGKTCYKTANSQGCR